MTKRSVSLIFVAALFAGLMLVAPDVLLVIFAGVILAVFLRGGGCWIARRTGLSEGWGIGIFALLVFAALVGSFAAFAPAMADQFNELAEKVPAALDDLRQRIAQYSWGGALLDRATPEGLLSPAGREAATAAVFTTFGALGSFVIILFVGLYGAIDPGIYRKGLLSLLAPSMQKRGEDVLKKGAATLSNWLAAQLMAMAVVGVLTALGLWLIGIPLAFLLGLIAALLAFIPNIGPVIAAVPAILLAFPEGIITVSLVVGVYIFVQTLESYIITPLIQQEKVSLPPAFIIAVQLLLGVLFGLLGLALATPLAALGLTLVRELYVGDYLAREGVHGTSRSDEM